MLAMKISCETYIYFNIIKKTLFKSLLNKIICIQLLIIVTYYGISIII